MKAIVLTVHAELVASERQLERGWIERAARAPEWRIDDPTTTGAERRFVEIPERGGKVLRVVCLESDTEIRVITVFMDRRAKRPA